MERLYIFILKSQNVTFLVQFHHLVRFLKNTAINKLGLPSLQAVLPVVGGSYGHVYRDVDVSTSPVQPSSCDLRHASCLTLPSYHQIARKRSIVLRVT